MSRRLSPETFSTCDVSRFDDGEFDAVVAYGGPLSYAFDRPAPPLTACCASRARAVMWLPP